MNSIPYTDITTAESSFDDEIASSEQEYIYDNDHFAVPAFVGDFLPPFSVRKLQLFIELAKIDLTMLNVSQLDEHFKLMKQLEKIRIYQAHLVKRRRKMATLRLLHVLEQEPDYRICDPNVLDERLRHKELLDKGLYRRESYYCDGEPKHYVRIAES